MTCRILYFLYFFFFNDTATTEIYTLSLHDALPIWGGKLVFISSVVGGAIDARFMPAILKGIMDCMEHGPLTGSYARDVRVIVFDGKMHPVDSNELSFMLAARHAFADAFKLAGPKILEPIYDLEEIGRASCRERV